jgi:hypothetical protein
MLRHVAARRCGSSIVVDVVAESDEDPLEPHEAVIKTQNTTNARQSASYRLRIGRGFCLRTMWSPSALKAARVPGPGASSVPA